MEKVVNTILFLKSYNRYSSILFLNIYNRYSSILFLYIYNRFSSDDVLDINTTKRASVISAINQTSDHLCTPEENNLFSKASCSLPTNESWAAIIWFVLAEIFSGFATSAINILGMSYIDLNTPKVKLPLYLGMDAALNINTKFKIFIKIRFRISFMNLFQC